MPDKTPVLFQESVFNCMKYAAYYMLKLSNFDIFGRKCFESATRSLDIAVIQLKF